MIYTLRTKVRVITQRHPNKFVQDAIDRGNMKLASIAKNVIIEYGIEPEQICPTAHSAYALVRGKICSFVKRISRHVVLSMHSVQLRNFSGRSATLRSRIASEKRVGIWSDY